MIQISKKERNKFSVFNLGRLLWQQQKLWLPEAVKICWKKYSFFPKTEICKMGHWKIRTTKVPGSGKMHFRKFFPGLTGPNSTPPYDKVRFNAILYRHHRGSANLFICQRGSANFLRAQTGLETDLYEVFFVALCYNFNFLYYGYLSRYVSSIPDNAFLVIRLVIRYLSQCRKKKL